MKQVSLKKVVFVLAIALIISVIFNLHYYVNLHIKNENILHTIRARALWTYGSEVSVMAYFLNEYLETLDYDLIDKEVNWGIARAIREADIFTQGLSEDSGLMYYELSRTARALENYFVWEIYGSLNTTKIETIAQALEGIPVAFFGFDMLKNKDPLEYLSPSEVGEVISYCRQIQETVGA